MQAKFSRRHFMGATAGAMLAFRANAAPNPNTLVINAGIFFLASTIVKGFIVDSFGAAFVGSLLLWLINWGFSGLVRPQKKNRVV